jgi:peptidoglycan/xylan/chitin deacetylase (PgdA/CDA1 family)
MTNRYITISVDDGFPLDSRVADLLNKYGLQATFYVPASNPEHTVMESSQIREISRQFEIGGHTYHHTGLKRLSQEKAWQEIYDGKKWLEDLLGQPVVSFCYPQGKFNRLTPRRGEKAGALAFSMYIRFHAIRSCGESALMPIPTAG